MCVTILRLRWRFDHLADLILGRYEGKICVKRILYYLPTGVGSMVPWRHTLTQDLLTRQPMRLGISVQT